MGGRGLDSMYFVLEAEVQLSACGDLETKWRLAMSSKSVCLSSCLPVATACFLSHSLPGSRRVIVSRPYVASHLTSSYKTASLFASVFWSSAMAIEM